MEIEDRVAFVTGSNRGIGRALVEGLLARGARRVYAATRTGTTLHGDPRVTPVRVDIMKPRDIHAAAALANDTQLLINNALGMLDVVRAFLPVLVANQNAAIVNVLPSVPVPFTQLLRVDLAGEGVRVYAAFQVEDIDVL